MPNAQRTWTKFYDNTPCYTKSQLVNSTFTCPATQTPWTDPLCSGNNGLNAWNLAGCCDCNWINYKSPAPHAYSAGSFRFVYGWVVLGTFCMVLFAFILLLLGSAARHVTPGQRLTSHVLSARYFWRLGAFIGGLAILGQFIAFSIWYSYITMIGFNVLGYTRYFALGASRVGVVMLVLAGATWMLGVVLQFTPFIRRRYISVHRWVGRITLICLFLSAVGLFLLVSGPHYGGFGSFFAGWTFGLYWIFCAFMGYYSIRNGRIQSHRIWMIRTVYLGFGIIVERAPQGLILKYLPLSYFIGANAVTLLASPASSQVLRGAQVLYDQWLVGTLYWWTETWSILLGEAYLWLAYDAGLYTTVIGPRRGIAPAPIYLQPAPAMTTTEELPLPAVHSYGWKTAIMGDSDADTPAIVMPTRGRAFRQVIPYLDHSIPLTLAARRQTGRNGQLLYLSLPHSHMSFSTPPGHDLIITAPIKSWQTWRSYTPLLLPPEIADLDPVMTPSTVLLLVKHMPYGRMSNHLMRLPVGSQVKAEGGLGTFSFTPGAYGHLGIIAAGSGISGVLSVMTAALCDPWDTSRIDLVYVNTTFEDILLKPQLDAMAKLYNDRLTITYVITSGAASGKHADTNGDLQLVQPMRVSATPSVPPPASQASATPKAAAPSSSIRPPVALAPIPAQAPLPPGPQPVAPATNIAPPPANVAPPVHAVPLVPVSLTPMPSVASLPAAPPPAQAAAEPDAVPAVLPVSTAPMGTDPSMFLAPAAVATATSNLTSPVPSPAIVSKPKRQPALAPPAPLPIRGPTAPGPLLAALRAQHPPPHPPQPPPPAPPPLQESVVADTHHAASGTNGMHEVTGAEGPHVAPVTARCASEITSAVPVGPGNVVDAAPATRGTATGATGLPSEAQVAATRGIQVLGSGAVVVPAAAPGMVNIVMSVPEGGAKPTVTTEGVYIPTTAALYYSMSPRVTMSPRTAMSPATSPLPAPPSTWALPNNNQPSTQLDAQPSAAQNPSPVQRTTPQPSFLNSGSIGIPKAAPASQSGHLDRSSAQLGMKRQSFASIVQPPPPARPAFLSNTSTIHVVLGPLVPAVLADSPLIKARGSAGVMQVLICGDSAFNHDVMHAMHKLGQPRAQMYAFGTSDR